MFLASFDTDGKKNEAVRILDRWEFWYRVDVFRRIQGVWDFLNVDAFSDFHFRFFIVIFLYPFISDRSFEIDRLRLTRDSIRYTPISIEFMREIVLGKVFARIFFINHHSYRRGEVNFEGRAGKHISWNISRTESVRLEFFFAFYII